MPRMIDWTPARVPTQVILANPAAEGAPMSANHYPPPPTLFGCILLMFQEQANNTHGEPLESIAARVLTNHNLPLDLTIGELRQVAANWRRVMGETPSGPDEPALSRLIRAHRHRVDARRDAEAAFDAAVVDAVSAMMVGMKALAGRVAAAEDRVRELAAAVPGPEEPEA